MSETKPKCCICGKDISGHTFNANPVWDGEMLRRMQLESCDPGKNKNE